MTSSHENRRSADFNGRRQEDSIRDMLLDHKLRIGLLEGKSKHNQEAIDQLLKKVQENTAEVLKTDSKVLQRINVMLWSLMGILLTCGFSIAATILLDK